MKIKTFILALAAVLALACAPAWAQNMAKIEGQCTGLDGKPVTPATIEMLSAETGQRYTLKTDSKGHFFSIAITPGHYKVSLVQNGAVLFFVNTNIDLTPDGSPVTVDFDLPKEQARAAGVGNGNDAAVAAAAAKAAEEAKKRAQDAAQIEDLNKQLTQARTDEQTGNYDQALSILNSATQAAPTQPILWAELGHAQTGAGDAIKVTDRAAASQHFSAGVTAYQKAVELKPAESDYHNNLGEAYSKAGDTEKALAEYATAAQGNPTKAAMYYFNAGAVLTNKATSDPDQATRNKDIDAAIEAFDKAVAANPQYAEAYYQKGLGLLQKATYDKAGNIIPAPGTTDAFQKYLEVAPTGPHAEDAKNMLLSLGAKVETSYKKPKTSK